MVSSDSAVSETYGVPIEGKLFDMGPDCGLRGLSEHCGAISYPYRICPTSENAAPIAAQQAHKTRKDTCSYDSSTIVYEAGYNGKQLSI